MNTVGLSSRNQLATGGTSHEISWGLWVLGACPVPPVGADEPWTKSITSVTGGDSVLHAARRAEVPAHQSVPNSEPHAFP